MFGIIVLFIEHAWCKMHYYYSRVMQLYIATTLLIPVYDNNYYGCVLQILKCVGASYMDFHGPWYFQVNPLLLNSPGVLINVP